MVNINTIFKDYNIELNASQIEKFGKLLSLFMLKNSQVNLSAIRDDIWIVEKHFLDSIMLNEFVELKWKVIDIWTGGWFPWIPLAITNPDVNFMLLDSTRKKIDAVNSFISWIWITNATWIWWRAEELSNNEPHKESYDFVVSRATAYLPQIMDWSYDFLKKGWKMFFYKMLSENELEDWILYAKKNNLKFLASESYFLWDNNRYIFSFIKL